MHSGRRFKCEEMEKFDAIIIGSGQAGNPLAQRLSGAGKRVALVEWAYVGGTCINDGCTPTKTLVGLAKTIAQARKAVDYGIALRNDIPDFKRISQRKDEVVRTYRDQLEKGLHDDVNIAVFHGEGRFSGYKEVVVKQANLTDKFLTADLIYINTGLRARIPAIEGLNSVPFLTSDSLLAIDHLPKELIMIGGGYISLEFAQIFRRLGSQVTLIEQSERLLPKEDEDVGREIARILEAEGVKIMTGSETQRVWADSDESVQVEIRSAGKLHTLSGSDLLIATGRTPNTADLELPNTGIQVDENDFIPVDDYLETSVPGIYALGDVKGGPAFTHVSYHDYLVLVENLLNKNPTSIRHRLIPYCLFIDPELGRVGLTEREAGEMGLDFSVAKMETSFIARAVEVDETAGFIKAIIDNGTKKILGAAIISPNGGELMSLLQVAMMGGLTYDQLRDTMFAHPTYAEAINNLFHPAQIKPRDKS